MLIGLEQCVTRCCNLDSGSTSDPTVYLEVRWRLRVFVTHRQLELSWLKLVDPLTWCGAAARHVYGDTETLALVAQAPI